MKNPAMHRLPIWVTLGIVLLAWLIQWQDYQAPENSFIRPIANLTYDWRVRQAVKWPSICASNLAVIYIDEDSLKSLALKGVTLPIPRQFHGQVIRELSRQGAKLVALDILFGEENRNESPVVMAVSEAKAYGLTPEEIARNTTRFTEQIKLLNGQTNREECFLVESDDFFAIQMRQGGHAVLAAEMAQNLIPPALFMTNAFALGDIAVQKDPDGSLRRIKAFRDGVIWNPTLAALAKENACVMLKTQIETNRCVFKKETGGDWIVPLDKQKRFEFKNLPGCPEALKKLPPIPAYSKIRAWNMGIVMAARELGLDLNHARVDLPAGHIVLTGTNGITRDIPVDQTGRLLINWSLPPDDQRLAKINYGSVLKMTEDYDYVARALRSVKMQWPGKYPFEGKLVVIGSSIIGSNMTDAGPTPVSPLTFFVSSHWNVANSIIMRQFIHPCKPLLGSFLILLMAAISAIMTWNLRVWMASTGVIFAALVYFGIATLLYVEWKFVAPIELPIAGGLLTHSSLLVCRVIGEQKERKRIRSVFAKLVSPNVVSELLGTDQLHFGGARREVSIYFADVRGFTEMTDLNQVRAEEFVREHQLSQAEADRYFDEQAREVLGTVNLYLSIIADMVKKRDGTLDKYIGDCVMAFWGAPTPNEKHAVACVKAAIDAQRAMSEINLKRSEENARREKENPARVAAGLFPLNPLSVLSLGSGINSGVVTVGLMGSQDHILNYTVFGREVNLASRLEGVSGRGRIIISEATHKLLLRDDPALAALCVEQPPVLIKGFRQAVKTFEVPWRVVTPTKI
jgi:class 3 adenylate cyclase